MTVSMPPLIAVVCCLVSAVGTAAADELPRPSGDVILTVSGKIGNTNAGDTAQFDRDMLEGLGVVDFTTSAPWYDDRMTFTGTPMAALLDVLAAEGETITAVALNDYEVEIPLADAWETGVILATKINGEVLSVRDKGPVFIIYPFDSDENLDNQTYYARSAWQVAQLVIR